MANGSGLYADPREDGLALHAEEVIDPLRPIVDPHHHLWERGDQPARAMFESNFSPDKGQCSYQVIFNAFKRIATPLGETEKTALFSKTATSFYRLALPS